MQLTHLTATPRQPRKKGAARQLRRAGAIPAILYGHVLGPAQPLQLAATEVRRAFHSLGRNILVNLVIQENDQSREQGAILKEVQRDPLSDRILHLDFQAVSLTEPVRVTVSVHLTGTPRGVSEGGVLVQNLTEVEVECLPTQIPEFLSLDVSDLAFGDTRCVGDLEPPPGVTILTHPEEVVASLTAPTALAEPTEAEEEAEGEGAETSEQK